jgi:hypothetical protein
MGKDLGGRNSCRSHMLERICMGKFQVGQIQVKQIHVGQIHVGQIHDRFK